MRPSPQLTNLRRWEMPSTLVEGSGLAGWRRSRTSGNSISTAPRIEDKGVEHLAKLAQLESLNLRHTDITDAGMAHMAALRNLKRLDLTSLDITEKGLAALAPLAHLEDLDLSFTRFAEPGLQISHA